jgi:flagellar biosynthesis protein FlhA
MAIDAELNAGSIDAQEAKKLRQEVADHADFYGAMDGASKFVRGDAIAGVIITLINIGVGLAVGMSHQMSLAEAASTFTKLTIGDGLVSQLPALLISLAAGLLVTRSHSKTNLPTESINQFFSTPIVLVMTAVFLGVMVLIDLPAIPLMTIACGFLAMAYLLPGDEKKSSSLAQDAAVETSASPAQPPVPDVGLDKLLSNDILEIELGLDLIPLADTRQGGTLLAAIAAIRKQLAEEMGLVLPKIRIRDNLSLDRNRYQVLLQGNVIETSILNPTAALATDTGNANGPLESSMILGMASEVAMPQPAYWIEPDNMLVAQHTGYEVHSAIDVLANQLKQLSLENAAHILTRDATRLLIDEVAKHSPSVVSELIPGGMSLAQVQQILKRLVSEGISIRPLSLILETLGDHCGQTKNHWELTEHVRVRLGRHISAGLAGAANEAIYAFTLASDLQDRVACAWDRDRSELRLELPMQVVESICDSIMDVAHRMAANGLEPIVLVDQSIRPVIAKLLVERQHEVFVLGSKEVVNSQVEVVGEITCQQVASCEAMAA